MMTPRFDYLIIGAGAAGSVLAHRLSTQPHITVALVEAGPDVVAGSEPADIRNIFPLSAFNHDYMWRDTRVHWRGADNSPAVPLQQGKIVGGSSAIMGMWALRGMPADYDKWRDLGATGWGWDDVLPFFVRLERDMDFGGALHGRDGPIPIRRESVTQWQPFARAVSVASGNLGMPHIDDMNADFRDGHCALPISRYADGRASAGICYLDANTRRRPNLTVFTGTEALQLVLKQRVVTGALLCGTDGHRFTIEARETIVAAGALRTPALLLRSGIGPAAQLASLGQPVVADRPGVGRNLQNHPIVYTTALLRPAGRDAPGWRPAGSTFIRWSSARDACTAGDLGLYIRSYLSWHALGKRLASLAPVLMRPFSRGEVTLDPRAPDAAPRVAFNFLSDARDTARMIDGFRAAATLFGTPDVAALCGSPFMFEDMARLMRFNQVSRWNAVRARLAATWVDLNPRGGMRALEHFAKMRPLATLMNDETELARFIETAITGTGHVCGTCSMGRADDPLAVTAPDGRVYGVDGLRVGDASLMPVVPSGNTHIPTVMVAEKIAATMQMQRRA
jgi:5-(hydroxymethyl)furfural/furfural oxidase